MQRRKRNHSHQLLSLFNCTKKSSTKHKQPFSNLWTATESFEIKQYDALLDPDANYYFTSSSVMEHCRKLKKIMRSQQRSTSNLSMSRNLELKKQDLKNVFEELNDHSLLLRSSNCKIIPYTESLKECSNKKLASLKRSLIQRIKNNEKQHKQYIKNEYVCPPLQKAQIRIVNTLQPIEKINFIKKCHKYREDGKFVSIQMR